MPDSNDVLVVPILGENYAFITHAAGRACVVDPGDAEPILEALDRHRLVLDTILVSHGHGDHTAGVAPLVRATRCRVVGPAGLPGVATDRTVGEGDTVNAPGLSAQVLSTPGHASPHVVFHDAGRRLLFAADLLFGGGCGRVAGGAYARMWESLQRVAVLPPETRVYFAHEYTEDNLRFAKSVDPDNPDLLRRIETVRRQRQRGEPTCPTTIGLELATNPFLRAGEPAIRSTLGMTQAPVDEVFAALRRRKDVFA